jgi:hypothetical protein
MPWLSGDVKDVVEGGSSILSPRLGGRGMGRQVVIVGAVEFVSV